MDLAALFLNYEPPGQLADLAPEDEYATEVRADRPPPKVLRKLNVEQITELVQLYESGVPVIELVDHFAIHDSTVRGHLKREGATKTPYRKLGSHADEIRQLHQGGSTIRDLATRFGVSTSTIFRLLSE